MWAKQYSEKLATSTFNGHKTSGDHDGRYYTESEVDKKLAYFGTSGTGNAININIRFDPNPVGNFLLLLSVGYDLLWVRALPPLMSSSISTMGITYQSLISNRLLDVAGIKQGNTIRVKLILESVVSVECNGINSSPSGYIDNISFITENR